MSGETRRIAALEYTAARQRERSIEAGRSYDRLMTDRDDLLRVLKRYVAANGHMKVFGMGSPDEIVKANEVIESLFEAHNTIARIERGIPS